jgi:hypothetical protein
MPRIACAQVKRTARNNMYRREKMAATLGGFFGFVFIRIYLSRRSLGEGGFVVKLDVFVS